MYKNKGGTVKTNWKEVAGEFMPPTLSIALWIYLMILTIGCWHYTVYIWDNWLSITAGNIRKVWSRAVNNVTKRTQLSHRLLGGNSHGTANE